MTKTGRPLTNVVITPEMYSAGVEAACLFTPSEDGLKDMIPAIFRAMLFASTLECLPDLSTAPPNRSPAGRPALASEQSN